MNLAACASQLQSLVGCAPPRKYQSHGDTSAREQKASHFAGSLRRFSSLDIASKHS